MEFSLISMWIMLSLFHTVESNRLPQLQEWNIFWMFCAFCMFRLWREIFSFLVHHFELSILYFKPFLHVFVLFSFTTLLKHSACTMYYQFYLNDYFSFFIVNSFWFFFCIFRYFFQCSMLNANEIYLSCVDQFFGFRRYSLHLALLFRLLCRSELYIELNKYINGTNFLSTNFLK